MVPARHSRIQPRFLIVFLLISPHRSTPPFVITRLQCAKRNPSRSKASVHTHTYAHHYTPVPPRHSDQLALSSPIPGQGVRALYTKMACTGSSLTVESYEDSPASVSTSILSTEGAQQRVPYSRRRHSSFHPRRNPSEGSIMEGDESYLLRVRPPCRPASFLCRSRTNWRVCG